MPILTKKHRFLMIFSCFLAFSPMAKPAGAEESRSLRLGLSEATEMALENNLQAILAAERISQSRGERSISLAALLPNLSAAVSRQNYTSNLAALGIPVSRMQGVSAFAGPNDRFDARLQLVQSVFDLASIWRYRVGGLGVSLAEDQDRLVRQQVIASVALGYIQLSEAEQGVQTAQANLQLARLLLELAVSQRDKGIATGVDTARAQTRLANQEVQLSQARTLRDTARINFLRIVGAPLSADLELSEELSSDPVRAPEPEAAIEQAKADRLELRIAERQARLAGMLRKAASADRLPSVSFFADYGSSGTKIDENSLPTRAVGVRVDIPVFNGGRTNGEVAVSASQERQAQRRLSDLRFEIERDVRVSLANLQTRESQVAAARQTVALAERELELSQDRFANGVADNIEVVNAQTSLENARQSLVSSTAQFNVARLNLAVALGHAESFRFR